ncbi:MAG: hypothetical protein KC469_08895 [Flavobacteriaceae bacterium]|nr:hypothetical protein [Flavobacteriaceae bacterium]
MRKFTLSKCASKRFVSLLLIIPFLVATGNEQTKKLMHLINNICVASIDFSMIKSFDLYQNDYKTVSNAKGLILLADTLAVNKKFKIDM